MKTILSNAAEVFRCVHVGKSGGEAMIGVGIFILFVLITGIVIAVLKSGRDV